MRKLLLVLWILRCAVLAHAQAIPPAQHWDVFLRRDSANPDSANLHFINLLSGESGEVAAAGERFTLTNSGVTYLDSETGRVMLAGSDGDARAHPAIDFAAGDYSVDWAASTDGQRIAWTIARQLPDGQLATKTWLADSDGDNLRELLADRPRAGIRLAPVAFRSGYDQLIMEARAVDAIEASPYQLRTGVFALDFAEGRLESRQLPADGACYCAFGFGADVMLRLQRGDSGYKAQVWPLDGGEPYVIDAPADADFAYAGNLLVSADDSVAVYALSQVGEDDSIRTVLARIDLGAARQEVISRPIPALARPLAFTEDNSALLFTIASEGGTWKLRMADGAIVPVADGVYLGRMVEA